MANEDDKYKEGVDFEWVQGNGDDNSNFQTRHFFTKAEKAARNAPPPVAKPTVAKPKMKKKSKSEPKATPLAPPEKITVTKLPDMPTQSLGTKLGSALGTMMGNQARRAISGPSKLETLQKQAADQKDISSLNQGMKELFTGRKGAAAQYKKGGMIKEGSAKDTREDKTKAKKAGMTMKKWESSAADVKHDAPKKMSTGGVVKKASGGSMRGTGAAVRGKGFSGCY